jgi:hypothetical protein
VLRTLLIILINNENCFPPDLWTVVLLSIHWANCNPHINSLKFICNNETTTTILSTNKSFEYCYTVSSF